MVDTSERLAKLRELLSQHQEGGAIDAWIAPTDDAHASECVKRPDPTDRRRYVCPADMRRSFISGFDGSAGTVLVTADEALLWTDGRYWNQAGKQLDRNWKLMKRFMPDVPTLEEYLGKMRPGSRVAIDPSLHGVVEAQGFRKALEPNGSSLVLVYDNPIDRIWTDRPPRSANPISIHEMKFAGAQPMDKISGIRKTLREKEAVAVVISALDEIAWLLNLRGTDIDFNPVFFAFMLITENKVVLFAQSRGMTAEVGRYLKDERVEFEPYENVISYLRSYASTLKDGQEVLLAENVSLALADSIGADRIETGLSIVAVPKAIKNPVELDGFRQCHLRDGAALSAFFAWLEEQLAGGAKIDEAQAADKLEEYRSQLDLYRGLSFPAISSTGPNAAVIHYKPEHVTAAVIDKDAIYLCDSGGQYSDGTTDVTRTLHFGTPSAEEIEANTLVLKGHIAIDQLVFPAGTTGFQLDPFARAALWQFGLDYAHGTGHGVGSYLNVHEGPVSISFRTPSNRVALQPGMILSNEPGFYKDEAFGIRIESLVVVKEVKPKHKNAQRTWLGFEHVTFTPIQTKLVDPNLLTKAEIDWLNQYNAETLKKIGPLLEHDQRAAKWLERECKAI